MTAEAWRSLDAELVRLKAEVERLATSASGADPGDAGASHLLDLPTERAAERLQRLRSVMDRAAIDDDPGRAVIGRRVTIRDEGDLVTYALVMPGDGDPFEGWISVDSPLGAAVLHGRNGDTVEVSAPAGRRLVTLEAVA